MDQPSSEQGPEAEAHLRSILATVPDAMVVIDEHGSILSFSAAAEKMFDYREDEVVGRNVKMLMPSPDRERHDQYLTNYLTTGKRKIIGIGRVTTGLHRDGSTFPMELSVVVELGTAGRPEAVLELTDANIDLKRNLIDPNQPGRVHSRKRRAIVPIAKAVRPWVEGIEGKLIKYKVPIAEKNRLPGGPTHFERETSSIKTAWNNVCQEVGIEGATPKTLRHTMLTWLAERGVHPEQRQVLAGHARRGTTARNYEHLSPDYLRDAIAQIDAFFDELAKHTKAHLRYAGDTQLELSLTA